MWVAVLIMIQILIFQCWELIKLNELILSIPLLVLTVFVIYKLNPRYCARCNHGTISPMYQHFRNNPNYPVQRYCLKCYLYINLSVWRCKCGNSGTHRIHKMNFISRILIIKGYKIVPKRCSCGSLVELKQK